MTLPGQNPIPVLNHRVMIYLGDVMMWLREMRSESVDCVVTSPPYWGLRDYGTAFWVDGDPGCDHQIGALTRTPWANRIKGPNGQRTIAGYRDQAPARHTGGVCLKCGARRADYQIGLEPTLGQHLDVMVNEVFAEIWRVLKPTGSVWLNYGDCYATEPNGRSADDTYAAGNDDRRFRDKPLSTIGPIYERNTPSRSDPKRRMDAGYQRDWSNGRGVFEGTQWGQGGAGTRRVDHGGRVVAGGVLKDKDLCMIPNRLAIALQEWTPEGHVPGKAGWWVRSEIIWGKANPMPDSSGRQRPSTAHEKIFLLTKSADADIWYARDTGEMSFDPDLSEMVPLITKPDKLGRRWLRIGAYYDAAEVMQESSANSHARMSQNIDGQAGSDRAHGGAKSNGPMKAVSSKVAERRSGIRNNASYNDAMMTRDREKQRSGRGSAPKVVDPRHVDDINHTGLQELGRGHGRLLRNYEEAAAPLRAPLPVWPVATKAFKDAHFATFPPELAERAILAGCPPSGLVLDPFGGSGTTALVALRHGRRCDMIELKPEYAEMAKRRLELDAMGEDERRRELAKEAAAKFVGPARPLPLIDGVMEAAE